MESSDEENTVLERIIPLTMTRAPSFAAALVVAEEFYKFGSFTLELVAFMPTWWVMNKALEKLVRA